MRASHLDDEGALDLIPGLGARGPVITAIKAKRVECFAKFCARRQPWTENARSRDGRPPFWERPGRALPNPEEYPVPRN
jgi:hypothetical protein